MQTKPNALSILRENLIISKTLRLLKLFCHISRQIDHLFPHRRREKNRKIKFLYEEHQLWAIILLFLILKLKWESLQFLQFLSKTQKPLLESNVLFFIFFKFFLNYSFFFFFLIFWVFLVCKIDSGLLGFHSVMFF